MELSEQLKEIGLTKSESAVYLFLLGNNLASPPQIAKGTGIARTNCYHHLQNLKDKGLIREKLKNKRKVYIANDPQILLKSLEQKKEAIEKNMPALRSLYTVQKNKPKVRFYEGLDGIKEIFIEMLSAKKILGFASTKKLFALDPNFFDWHQDQMIKNKVEFIDILSHASKEEKTIKKLKGLYTAKFLPEKYGDIPTNILIWNDNVTLMTLEEPLFTTTLTNADLAGGFRMAFDVMWNNIKQAPSRHET